MFKASGKGSTGSPGFGAVDTLVGVKTELLGDIQFTGGLHIDGTVKGKVSATGTEEAMLSVSETGSIEGDVHVANVVLNGSIHGDVHATGKLTLNSRARVTGNVYYQVMEMASGATINGQMIHETGRDTSRANVTSLDARAVAPKADDDKPLQATPVGTYAPANRSKES